MYNINILYSVFRVENCKSAMLLAKEHLNIPRVISPEDFASEALDELSAMTYLSYFVRSESPGYYDTLNWVCKQLRTTQITNLTVNVALSYDLNDYITFARRDREREKKVREKEKIDRKKIMKISKNLII